MFGKAVGLAALRPQLQHFIVDLLNAVNVHFPPHFFKEGDQHIGHHPGIVGGPVVVEGRQIQILRHDIQLILMQLRQQILGQDQRVDIRRLKVKPHLFAPGADEADIEGGVVGRQRPAVHKFQKRRQGFLQRGSVGQHGVGDTGQADDLRRQTAVGIDKGLEGIRDLSVFQHHRADLRNGLGSDLQAGGLNVETDDLTVERLILIAVYGDAVIQVIDKIALHAVEDLDLACVVPGVREGLHHAVIGDGDGGVTPCDRLLDDAGGVGQGIHIGHTGMQMQFHPLFRTGVLAPLVDGLGDILRPQLDILAVSGQLNGALYPQPHAGVDETGQRLGLFFVHVSAHGDAAGVVGHIEGQAPLSRPPGFTQFGGKDLALHYDDAHLGIQVHHGNGFALDGLAHQHLAAGFFSGGLGRVHHEPQLAQVVFLHQQLPHRFLRGAGQHFTALNLQFHGAAVPVQHAACYRRVMQQQPKLPGWQKAVKKIKKRYFIRHSYHLTVSRSPPSRHPPDAPAAPCTGSHPCGTADPHRRRRQCPRRRSGPRRDR